MKTVMRIWAEPNSDREQIAYGTFMGRFPYPEPIIYYVTVPEPYQAGPEVELPTERVCPFINEHINLWSLNI
jgi:hypothetical protein